MTQARASRTGLIGTSSVPSTVVLHKQRFGTPRKLFDGGQWMRGIQQLLQV